MSDHRACPLPGTARGFLIALLLVLAAPHGLRAQNPAAPIRTICVDAFQGKFGAADLRTKVIGRLRALGSFRLVDNPADADAVLHGSGELWIKGYLSFSPHNPSGSREPVYGGYLSLDLQSRSGETLWSYLVTPGRLHWKSAGEDMADHIVHLMAAAIAQHSGTAVAPPSSTSLQLALTGAGSTFSAPLYQDWIESFEERHPEIRTTYQAVGSEEGIRLLEEGKVDFAGSDVPLSDDQMAALHVRFDHFATVLGAIVPAYNLPALGRDLHFTPAVLADIYMGKVLRWNDTRLRELNHGISLPDQPIVVVHRSDGSGTTAAFTAFLSATSPAWKSAVGSGMRVNWPVGEAVQGNEGAAQKVAATPGAIGYMELTWAIRNELNFGMVRNAAGSFVQANLATLSAAAASVRPAADLRASLVDAPGRDAWPITTFTWILLPVPIADSQKSAALHDLLRWMLTTGQKECSGLGYLPLPKEIADRELRRADAPNGAIPAAPANAAAPSDASGSSPQTSAP
jgi:phosphate ABC transporter phosphate-binding protein